MSAAVCTCLPCLTPAYGVPGWDHCAACCYGTLIEEYDHNCPVTEHREMAERQAPTSQMIIPPGG